MAMKQTILSIPKMDCPSEEQLIRFALQHEAVHGLDFDLANRRLTVLHDKHPEGLLERLSPLNLGARILETGETAVPGLESVPPPVSEAKTLILLLVINAALFVVEIIVGWLAESVGLIADSLDMLADAAVYGVSLSAVDKTTQDQVKSARLSGYLQILLAAGAFFEVGRRFWFGSEPEPPAMMAMALVALIANVLCIALLAAHRHGGVHMRASWIFSTNDVIANLGVILAGALVAWTHSHLPDLVIGGAIAGVVLTGAIRILRFSTGKQLTVTNDNE